MYIFTHVCADVCVYMCIYTCMYIYMYIHIHMHKYKPGSGVFWGACCEHGMQFDKKL